MIKVDENGFGYDGTKLQILSELTLVMHTMYEDNVLDDHLLDLLTRLVKTPKKDLYDEAALKLITTLVDVIGMDGVREIVNGGENK